MNFQKDEIESKVRNFLRKTAEFLKNKGEWIIPVVFVAAIVYSVYLWYSYAFNPSWSDAKKSEYVRSKQKDIVFDKEKFNSVISEIKERKINYQKNLPSIPDIFRFK